MSGVYGSNIQPYTNYLALDFEQLLSARMSLLGDLSPHVVNGAGPMCVLEVGSATAKSR